MIGRRGFRVLRTTPWALALAGSLSFAWVLASCGQSASRVTVVNASGRRLEGLRVVAERESSLVRSLGPGDSASVRPPWHGDDMVMLRGSIAGEPLAGMMGAYVENGYTVRFIVDSTGFVAAHVALARY